MPSPTGSPGRPSRHVAVLIGAGLLWLAALPFLFHYALGFVARCLAAAESMVSGYAPALLISGKTALLVLLLALAVVLAVVAVRRAAALGMRRAWWVAGFVAIAAAAGVGQTLLYTSGEGMGTNRWGFFRTFQPGTYTIDHGWPQYPPMKLKVNRESYRDGKWTIPPPEDGTIRVLLVGDSQVWGYGLPDNAATLDSQLEQRLNARGGPRWDVWNVAAAPASLWYYAEAVRRIAPDARPHYAVVSIFPEDVTLIDEQRALADRPDWYYALAERVDLLADLLWMNHHVWWPENNEEIARDPDVVATNAAYLDRLVTAAAELDLPLVLWEPVTPVPLLDRYRGRPGLTFAGWETPPRPDGTPRLWTFDPAFAFPDGHPLPVTNGHFADRLAEVLSALHAQRALSAGTQGSGGTAEAGHGE